MNKFDEKFNKLTEAVKRLSEAIEEYNENPSSTVRDGAIQRFEFCTELAWKATREYLIDQGYTDINSPKEVMRKAYADKLIDDERAWVDLLNARNITSHIYSEETAREIFDDIGSIYLEKFIELIGKLQ